MFKRLQFGVNFLSDLAKEVGGEAPLVPLDCATVMDTRYKIKVIEEFVAVLMLI